MTENAHVKELIIAYVKNFVIFFVWNVGFKILNDQTLTYGLLGWSSNVSER